MIRLPMLPDRAPIRIMVPLAPELHRRLCDYAEHYQSSYGRNEPLTDLIAAMLAAWIDNDRDFARARRGKDEGAKHD